MSALGYIRQKYLSQWSELSGWRGFLFYLLHYTVLFLLLQRLVFWTFYETDSTFIWRVDGMRQYFADLAYTSKSVRDSIQELLNTGKWTFPLYDFCRPLFPVSLEKELLQWLAVLCPWDKIDIFYDFLVILRFYLSGISFSLLGFYFKQRSLPILVGSITYIFCGYGLEPCIRHPAFLQSMVYFPLLIIGAEKLLRRERGRFIFTGVVFLCLISSIYLSCMYAILILLYLFVRYFLAYRSDGLRGFGRLIGSMALWGGGGILLSCAIVVPTLFQMFGTDRIGREVASLLLYEKNYYSILLNRFLVGVGSNTDNYTSLGYTVIALPAILLLFTQKGRDVTNLKAFFLLLSIMLCLPSAGYIMSGFNAPMNRWVFAYSLCVAAIVMFELPSLAAMTRESAAFVLAGVIGYAALCYFLPENRYYMEGGIALLLTAALLVAACYIAGKRGRRFVMALCLLLTCLSVCYSSFVWYSPSRGNAVANFVKKGTPYPRIAAGQYASIAASKVVSEDTSLFNVLGNNIGYDEIGSSGYFGLNGLSYSTSLTFPAYRAFTASQEVMQRGMLIQHYGIDARAPLLSLTGVKYYAVRDQTTMIIPYGFQEVDRIRNGEQTDIIFENRYALPFGYTYDTWMSRDEYEQLTAIEKQEALMQSVVLDTSWENATLSHGISEITAHRIQVDSITADGIQWADGTIVVQKENAALTLSFQGEKNTDTYLRINDFDILAWNPESAMLLTVSTDHTSARTNFASDQNIYASGAKTQLIYLGNCEAGFTTCTVYFPTAGTFHLEDLEIWCQPMDGYAEQIEALRAEALENVETNCRGLTGTISTTKDKFLCFSIPYDKGWTAYVDGKKTNLVQANIGFMGVELPAGDHDIELKYWPPGLTIGIALSCIGLAGAAGLAVYTRRDKRRDKTGK